MIREIVRYPSPLSVEYATDVRVFDENILTLIEDLKETIAANDLEGLAAFQIGSYYNVVVVKDEEGEFIELINPRLIAHEGKITQEETTAYYGNLSANVTRFDKISVHYQDRSAKDTIFKAEGVLSRLLQRKIDYTFGATFLQKLSAEQREEFEKKLECGSNLTSSDYCPTTFKRDYILKAIKYLYIGMLLMLVSFFFLDEAMSKKVWEYQLYATYSGLGLNVIYFFYAQYEGSKYQSCSSCQLGNIIGTSLISLIKLGVLISLSYFLK